MTYDFFLTISGILFTRRGRKRKRGEGEEGRGRGRERERGSEEGTGEDQALELRVYTARRQVCYV